MTKYIGDFKTVPARLVPVREGVPMTFGTPEIRNECWNCGNYWDLKKPMLPHEIGQKRYYYCNHCNKVNHK